MDSSISSACYSLCSLICLIIVLYITDPASSSVVAGDIVDGWVKTMSMTFSY